MPGQGIEVGVMVEEGKIIAQRHRSNQAVDQPPNRVSLGSTPSVQQRRGLIVRARDGEHRGSADQTSQILQVRLVACSGQQLHCYDVTNGDVTCQESIHFIACR